MITWYLIDEHGQTPVPVPHGQEPAGWPAFAQVALKLPVEDAIERVRALVARERFIDDEPHDICFARSGDWTLIEEVGVDLDLRCMHALSADMLAHMTACDLAMFSHDPAHASLELDLYERGELVLHWEDHALGPDPGAALTFHADGRCTHEAPRRYALRALNLPEDTPILDRYAFIEFMLHGIDLHHTRPNLHDLMILHRLTVG